MNCLTCVKVQCPAASLNLTVGASRADVASNMAMRVERVTQKSDAAGQKTKTRS